MLRTRLAELISASVKELTAAGKLPAVDAPIEVTDTKSPEHGDYTCNFALVASKQAGMNPRALAELLKPELEKAPDLAAVEVAGPGFLNLRVNPKTIAAFVPQIIALGDDLPNSKAEKPMRLNVEFVSVNPNGPITVGSGRGAAFGDALSRVFEAAGHQVDREYYINDGVNSEQMRLFAESVRHYYMQSEGHESAFPEKGYRGAYVEDVAKAVKERHGVVARDVSTQWFQKVSQDLMIERQRSDMELFGVRYSTWFGEQSMHDSGLVERTLTKLKGNGSADEDPVQNIVQDRDLPPGPHAQEPGALWLRSSRFGDDKDRVLVRRDGRPAYIAGDLAYMESKLGERSYDKAYLILGPDHHGYIGRMNAVCQALGFPLGRFEIIIFQIVRFVKDGEPAPMRKRDGNIYELRDLLEELGANVAPNAPKEEQLVAGKDVARFFYLMRSHDTHMDFDIDLATKQSDENPVFYVQYAHARICSVLRKAVESGFDAETWTTAGGATSSLPLTDPRELALIKKILDLPFETARCAADYGVHRLTTYAVELARTYHHFYDACRVVQPDQPELSKARLQLCEATRIALKATLDLLGVSAPQRMDRN